MLPCAPRAWVLAEKRKKHRQGTEPAPAIALLEGPPGSALVAADTPNADAWRSGRTLRVGDQLYQVIVNPPSVLKVRLQAAQFRKRKILCV